MKRRTIVLSLGTYVNNERLKMERLAIVLSLGTVIIRTIKVWVSIILQKIALTFKDLHFTENYLFNWNDNLRTMKSKNIASFFNTHVTDDSPTEEGNVIMCAQPYSIYVYIYMTVIYGRHV